MKTWTAIDEKLTKEFVFQDFDEAISFINMIADIAEEHNHHPDILVHDYNRVKIMLRTHSAKAITQRDHDLAQAIDDLGRKEKK